MDRANHEHGMLVAVVGVVLIVVVLVVILPIAFMMGGALVAAALGQVLTADAEARHEGSELIDLNT